MHTTSGTPNQVMERIGQGKKPKPCSQPCFMLMKHNSNNDKQG